MPKCLLVSNTDWYLYNFRRSLAEHLRNLGWEVGLVAPHGLYVPRLESAGFRFHTWQVGRQSVGLRSEWEAWRRIFAIYQQEQPDLVHHHTIKPVLYGTMAARRARLPAIVNSITGRGYVFLGQDARATRLRRLVEPAYRMALAAKNVAVIFENEIDQSYFFQEKLVKASQAHLVESVGVDIEHFYPTPEPDGLPVITLAARLLWDKGVGDLVAAARLLRERGVEARFVLVGEPDPGNPSSIDQEQIEKWQAEGLVECLGWQADMQAVYTASQIVTLPSRHEGVPTSLLEAAASGRPLVASDIPGCRAIVIHGKTGLLVPPGDVAALADALVRLIGDRELRGRMGAAGRELVLKKFTQSQINAQTTAIYEQLLGTKQPITGASQI
jgi:glycosyltransferase involved in cell wall biosynthesis